MCKITSMELYGTELDMPVVRDFELWFQTAFGVSDREAWWVLAHYVSRRSAEPDGEVIAHLLFSFWMKVRRYSIGRWTRSALSPSLGC
jgi:hypothetical protein